MPFCPVCRFEYNPGITTCPDYGAKLVPELDEPKKPDNDVELVSVGAYLFVHQAEEARLRLEQVGIQSVVMDEIASRSIEGSSFTVGGVRVVVRKEDAPRAEKILQD
jgi:hypothetical protein